MNANLVLVPGFSFGQANAADAGSSVVFEVRRGIESASEIFDDYADRLSFPPYFGRNWDAFDECLCDLHWIDFGKISIVHSDVPLVHDRRLGKMYSLFAIHAFVSVSILVLFAMVKGVTALCRDSPPGGDSFLAFAIGMFGWIYSFFLVFLHGIRITGAMIVKGQKNRHVRLFCWTVFLYFIRGFPSGVKTIYWLRGRLSTVEKFETKLFGVGLGNGSNGSGGSQISK